MKSVIEYSLSFTGTKKRCRKMSRHNVEIFTVDMVDSINKTTIPIMDQIKSQAKTVLFDYIKPQSKYSNLTVSARRYDLYENGSKHTRIFDDEYGFDMEMVQVINK